MTDPEGRSDGYRVTFPRQVEAVLIEAPIHTEIAVVVRVCSARLPVFLDSIHARVVVEDSSGVLSRRVQNFAQDNGVMKKRTK
jgi:hypothetical protein